MNWKEFFNKETFTEAELNEAHEQAELEMLDRRKESDKYPAHERVDVHQAYQDSIEILGTISQLKSFPELSHKFTERVKRFI